MTTAHWLRWTALVAVIACTGAQAARAGDPPPAPPGGAAPGAVTRETLLDKALGALRLRMEAKLKEAELLERAGKIDEALAATRDVDRLYRETLDDLQRLIGAAQPAVRPAEDEPTLPDGRPVPGSDAPEPGLISPSEGPGEGGSFAGRGGAKTGARADAVLHGLRWLAAHQSGDGSWETAGFDKWCDGKPNTGPKPDGMGKPMYDVGITGLALCAFLGAGYTNRGDHEFAKVVGRGLNYLKNMQDAEGCFGPRTTQHFIYNHACASLAMLEAFGMTQSPIFHNPAQQALSFIARARNPYFSWRYGVKPGDNDLSVTGWMTMVLKSARLANEDALRQGRPAPLVIDEEAFEGVRAWIDKMTDPDFGRAGYIARGQGPARPMELVDKFPADRSESMTAVAVLLRVFLGENPSKSDMVKKGSALMQSLAPTWDTTNGSIDMYYWYFGGLAMFQVGGSSWPRWGKAIDQAIVPNQRKDGTYCVSRGSWDPVDPWGPEGGRVYSTALMTMCCEVAWRYERAFGAR